MRATAAAPTEKAHRVEVPCAMRFGGRWTIVRRLGPEDAPKLIEFFHTHTEDTIRSRYGYFVREMTSERAAELVGVDQTRDAALGVFELGATGTMLIAVGRYCLSTDGASAEVAFVVREDRRDCGIAMALLRALERIACERGLHRLIAQVQYDNPAMLAVFRREGARIADIPGTGSMAVELRLAPEPRQRGGA